MAQTIKNINQIAKALMPKISSILELVAADTKEEIDKYLQYYYSEFKQEFYKRTEYLKKCCKISDIKYNGENIEIEVYLDVNSLHYDTKGADPYKTVTAANTGMHGGYNPANMSAGQVPWSTVKNSNGERIGSGTMIWEDPKKELIDNGKLIEIFKRCAQQRGLNLKQ